MQTHLHPGPAVDPGPWRRFLWIALGLLLLAVLCACFATQVPVPRVLVGNRPGFWLGLWHGFVAPVAFFVRLFSESTRLYAFPNAGAWYDFGFMLGISGFSGGLFAGSRTRPRRRAEPD
jgi:hypothetical protein